MKRFFMLTLISFALIMTAACEKKEPVAVTEWTSEENTSDTETATEEPTTAEINSDFEISDPKWVWIKWDADGDGTEDELEFRFHDNGDEAPSVFEITLYKGDDKLTGWLDRAYSIYAIRDKEDATGPYLEIPYEKGDYYNTETGVCTVRFVDGHLEIVDLGIE